MQLIQIPEKILAFVVKNAYKNCFNNMNEPILRHKNKVFQVIFYICHKQLPLYTYKANSLVLD